MRFIQVPVLKLTTNLNDKRDKRIKRQKWRLSFSVDFATLEIKK